MTPHTDRQVYIPNELLVELRGDRQTDKCTYLMNYWWSCEVTPHPPGSHGGGEVVWMSRERESSVELGCTH